VKVELLKLSLLAEYSAVSEPTVKILYALAQGRLMGEDGTA